MARLNKARMPMAIPHRAEQTGKERLRTTKLQRLHHTGSNPGAIIASAHINIKISTNMDYGPMATMTKPS